MPHVRYDINKLISLADLQYGAGNFEGFRFQRGTRHFMRGGGILGVLGKAWRYLVPLAKHHLKPLAKSALKALAEEGLEAGSKALADIARGKEVRDTIVTEGTQALKNVAKRAGTKLQQAGSGKKSKRKLIAPKKRSLNTLHLVGRSVLEKTAKKKRRPQTLGLY